MVRALLCGAVVIAAMAAAPCQARDGDFASGQMLARACGSNNAGEKSLCDGYIAGALDTVALDADHEGQHLRAAEHQAFHPAGGRRSLRPRPCG